jgi:hypothetical protein
VPSIRLEIFSEAGQFESANEISRNKNIKYEFERNEEGRVCNFESVNDRDQY